MHPSGIFRVHSDQYACIDGACRRREITYPNTTNVIMRRAPEDSLKFTEIMIVKDILITPIDRITHPQPVLLPSIT
jgi:hypothetical protein